MNTLLAPNAVHNFELAAGSVIGSHHRRAGVNNQDAFATYQDDRMLISILCDGASKGRKTQYGDWTKSDVGAQLCARWTLASAKHYTTQFLHTPHQLTHLDHFPYLEDIKHDVLEQIRQCASQMEGGLAVNAADYFVCTVLGVIVTSFGTIVFCLGDGLFIYNGRVYNFGPFEDNMPPYIVYNLTGSPVTDAQPELLNFRSYYIATADIDSLLLGTDGVEELIDNEETIFPGTNERIGPISQFWLDDRYYDHPVAVTRQLSRINMQKVILDREAVRVQQHHGFLSDDTTLVAIRRKHVE